jgi:hypothetical protein
LLDVQSTGEDLVEPHVLVIRQNVIPENAADAPEGAGEATPGPVLGEIGPQGADESGARVMTVAEDDQVAQQIAGLLGGQLKGLPITLDTQPTKGIEAQHMGL